MRSIKLLAIAAVGALIIVGLADWIGPNTPAFVPAQQVSQTNPFEIMTNAKGLPTQTIEDRTFVF